jgi:hypothetical protein
MEGTCILRPLVPEFKVDLKIYNKDRYYGKPLWAILIEIKSFNIEFNFEIHTGYEISIKEWENFFKSEKEGISMGDDLLYITDDYVELSKFGQNNSMMKISTNEFKPKLEEAIKLAKASGCYFKD